MTRALLIFPQTTHPVTAGSQVRIIHLIRHLHRELKWDIDFFCPQGLLRRESWGETMDHLHNIYIPREVALPEEGPLFTLTHVRNALKGGVLHGLVKDVREFRKRLAVRLDDTRPKPVDFELVSHHNRALDPKAVPPKQVVPPKPAAKPASSANGFAGTASPVSSRMERYNRSHLKNSIRELLNRNSYDVVLITYVWMSPVIDWLFEMTPHPLLICDTIDIQYVRESRLEKFRGESGFRYAEEKALELSWLRKFDLLLTITPADEAELKRELPDKAVATVQIEARLPESVGAAIPDVEARLKRHKHDLIFIGTDNEANVYTVLKLVQEIVPAIKKQRPGLTVALAGRICDNPQLKEITAAQPHIKLAGYVESVEDFIRTGRVLAAPIPAGGGIKVKILDALAHGIPVVTTPIGAEGLDFVDGRDGYVTETDEQFVEKVLVLLANPQAAAEMGILAQQHILDSLHPTKVYGTFDGLIRAKLANRSA